MYSYMSYTINVKAYHDIYCWLKKGLSDSHTVYARSSVAKYKYIYMIYMIAHLYSTRPRHRYLYHTW